MGRLGKAVASADALRDELIAQFGTAGRGAFPVVRARVNEADIAIAVWRDLTQPRDIGWKLIKGAHFMGESIAANGPDGETWARIVGIPCIEAEQAEAVFDVIGERDRRH